MWSLGDFSTAAGVTQKHFDIDQPERGEQVDLRLVVAHDGFGKSMLCFTDFTTS